MEQYHSNFEIGGVRIAINSEFQISLLERFLPYRSEKEPEYCAELQLVDTLPEITAKCIIRQRGFDVFDNGNGGYLRVFYDEIHGRKPYAVGEYNLEQHFVSVCCLRDEIRNVDHIRGAFFHLAWEEIMLLEGRLIVHACMVSTEQGGILFSGPSGVGKSTQGELWAQYTGAHVVNGDRPILRKKKSGWFACGSPYAGSSKYFLNEQVPIRAIVMLRQAKTCSIRQMKPPEAFRALWPGLTVSDWDAALTDRAVELCSDVAMRIPFYALDCTPDRNAVEMLQQTLMGAGA